MDPAFRHMTARIVSSDPAMNLADWKLMDGWNLLSLLIVISEYLHEADVNNM